MTMLRPPQSLHRKSGSTPWLALFATVSVLAQPLAAQSNATVSATLDPSKARYSAIPGDFEGFSIPMGSIAKGNYSYNFHAQVAIVHFF